jgi:hypothetical protein
MIDRPFDTLRFDKSLIRSGFTWSQAVGLTEAITDASTSRKEPSAADQVRSGLCVVDQYFL